MKAQLIYKLLHRLQTRAQNDACKQSSLHILRHTLRGEGLRGLWRGGVAASIGQAPSQFAVFGVYSLASQLISESDHAPGLASFHALAAGAVSGLAHAIAIAPFEHLKVQQQMICQPGAPHLGLLDTARAVVRAGGMLHLMRGTAATALRDAPSFGVYFWSYELLKSSMSRPLSSRHGDFDALEGACISPEHRGRKPAPIGVLLLSGSIAGVLSWLIALPADVIKTMVQGSPAHVPRSATTIAIVARKLYASGGIPAFFR